MIKILFKIFFASADRTFSAKGFYTNHNATREERKSENIAIFHLSSYV